MTDKPTPLKIVLKVGGATTAIPETSTDAISSEFHDSERRHKHKKKKKKKSSEKEKHRHGEHGEEKSEKHKKVLFSCITIPGELTEKRINNFSPKFQCKIIKQALLIRVSTAEEK